MYNKSRTMKTKCPPEITSTLGRSLILDELFALLLYRRFKRRASPALASILDELIAIEEKHYAFWQQFLGHSIGTLNIGRRLKFSLCILLTRLFGEPIIHLLLEAIEVNGIRKYLTVWDICAGTQYEHEVRSVLEDELSREDAIVSRVVEKKINPGHIRNIFFGFNDGLVEILGAVSGFAAAFEHTASVMVAGLTVAIAGSISMAAGAYVALGSENEVTKIKYKKECFKNKDMPALPPPERPLLGATLVGISYFIGSLLPLLPIFAGTQTITLSLIIGGVMVIILSAIISFFSGMNMRRRIATNVCLITSAVLITYALGTYARTAWNL